MLTAVILAITGVPAFFLIMRPAPVVPPIAFSEFMQHVEQGRVARVNVEERHLVVGLQDGTQVTTVAPTEFLKGDAAFLSSLTGRNIRVEWAPLPDPNALNYPAILTGIAFFGLICFTVYRTTSGRIPSPCRYRRGPL